MNMKPILSPQQKRVLTPCVAMYMAAYVCRLNLRASYFEKTIYKIKEQDILLLLLYPILNTSTP